MTTKQLDFYMAMFGFVVMLITGTVFTVLSLLSFFMR